MLWKYHKNKRNESGTEVQAFAEAWISLLEEPMSGPIVFHSEGMGVLSS